MRGVTPRLRTHEPTAKHLLSAHPSNPPTPARPVIPDANAPVPDALALSPECARTTAGRTRCARPPGPGRHGLPTTPGKAAW